MRASEIDLVYHFLDNEILSFESAKFDRLF